MCLVDRKFRQKKTKFVSKSCLVLLIVNGIVLGTYFGLAVTWWLTPPDAVDHEEHASDYVSDRLSIAGTLFLWIMYPSFNAAEASLSGGVTRALINTLLSLCGCVMGYSVMSRLVTGHKFSPVHLQNAS